MDKWKEYRGLAIPEVEGECIVTPTKDDRCVLSPSGNRQYNSSTGIGTD